MSGKARAMQEKVKQPFRYARAGFGGWAGKMGLSFRAASYYQQVPLLVLLVQVFQEKQTGALML